MSKKKLIISKGHTYNFLKLCYILIIVVALFMLKFIVYPENEFQLLLALNCRDLFMQSLIYSLAITVFWSVVLIKALEKRGT